LFRGVAQPVTQSAAPPAMEGGTPEAACAAMGITKLHRGLHAGSI
jgi:choline-glycine betaine transporter